MFYKVLQDKGGLCALGNDTSSNQPPFGEYGIDNMLDILYQLEEKQI
jgi:hypothetical protein